MVVKKITINGLALHSIGIGTYLVGGGKYDDGQSTQYVDIEKGEKDSAGIKYSLSLGQNFIDTAEFYSAGYSEVVVGNAIKGFDRKRLFIGSKVWKIHLKRSAVVYAIKEMLKRLQTDYLDIIYPHFPWKEYEPMKEYVAGLNDAVNMRLVKSIGVSNCDLEQLKRMSSLLKSPIVACQIEYNILNKKRLTKGLREYCKENDIVIVAYRPLGTGSLTTNNASKVLFDVSKKYKKTPAQVALNWLISQDNMVAIPKAIKRKHIDENLGAVKFEMEEKDIKILDSL